VNSDHNEQRIPAYMTSELIDVERKSLRERLEFGIRQFTEAVAGIFSVRDDYLFHCYRREKTRRPRLLCVAIRFNQLPNMRVCSRSPAVR
jgi:hypothetical protein